MRVKVLFARFPYGQSEHPDVTDWLIDTLIKCERDPRIEYKRWKKSDTPIPMLRNEAVEMAKKIDADYLLMIDNDMSPDEPNPGAKPFWDSTIDFMLNSREPCVVGAPYCGPPPINNVYVFRWANRMNPGHANGFDGSLEQFTREEAAKLAGIQEVSALPTGLILIDMRVFAKLTPPYFYYEYEDRTESKKASTEDVTFTRDVSLAGMPIYCNWDAWAVHNKPYRVGKPQLLTSDMIREQFRESVLRNEKSGEKMIEVRKNSVLDRFLQRKNGLFGATTHHGDEVCAMPTNGD